MESYTSDDFAMIQEYNSQETVKRIDSDSMMHAAESKKAASAQCLAQLRLL